MDDINQQILIKTIFFFIIEKEKNAYIENLLILSNVLGCLTSPKHARNIIDFWHLY